MAATKIKGRQEELRNFACFLAKLFNENDIDYWADFGTLLGIVRDNDIIAWDNDFDFSIIREEAPKIYGVLDKILSYKGVGCANCHWDNAIKILFYKRAWFCDIYPWEKDGDLYRHPQSCFGLPTFPASEIEDFTYLDFHGVKVRVPIYYEDRLIRLYDDWKTPKKPGTGKLEYWNGERVAEYNRRNK